VHDGAQGLLGIFRLPPDVAILGADLPGISAPAIAEIVRRAPHLRGQPLIRVAPPGEPAVASEFEATYTLPPGEIPAGLAPLLGRLGFEAPAAQPEQPEAAASPGVARPQAGQVPRGAPERAPAPSGVPPQPLQPPAVKGAPPAPHSAPSEAAKDLAAASSRGADALDALGEELLAAGPPAERAEAEKLPPREVGSGARGGAEPRPTEPEARPAAKVGEAARPKSAAADRPMPASGDAAPAPEVAMAQRLARIIVADIILYNEEKFAQAVEDGNLEEALKPELQEGLALFKQRIPAEVRAKCDFVREELKRRAALVRGVA
jgi:hypothetical protein